MATPSLDSALAATRDYVKEHASLRDALAAATPGAVVVVHDRNSHAAPWRIVRLLRTDKENKEEAWRLYDKDGVVLHEPDSGCPASGFSTSSLLDDVAMEYYEAVPTPKEKEGSCRTSCGASCK